MTDTTTVPETKTGDEVKAPIEPAPSQKPERTPQEIASYNLGKRAEEARALGLDPAAILNIKPSTPVVDAALPDDKPLTVKDLRDIQRADARKTAEEMAEAIADPIERDDVKRELGFIVPSGDPQADFRRAQASANAERNARIAEDQGRRGEPRRTAAGGSTPPPATAEFVPTAEEQVFMRPPYNLNQAQIIARRPK